ncbi:MAG: hypothetical protein AAB944_00760 [Patescibacteria group bacterium]
MIPFFFMALICVAPFGLYMLTADERLIDFGSHTAIFFAGYTFAQVVV